MQAYESGLDFAGGTAFIAEKILLSHEPVYGLPWCLNIHGHDHNNVEAYKEGCKHINLATNVCGYTPINHGMIIKEGVLVFLYALEVWSQNFVDTRFLNC